MELQLLPVLILALDGDEWPASRPGRLTPGERATIPIGYVAGWTPEPVWTQCWREKYLTAPGIKPYSSNR
jgi:hypothetical protein